MLLAATPERCYIKFMTVDELNNWISTELNGAEAISSDLTGGGNHFEVTVICADFDGKTRLECQRKVMDVLAPLFQGPLHAATIKTLVRRPSK